MTCFCLAAPPAVLLVILVQLHGAQGTGVEEFYPKADPDQVELHPYLFYGPDEVAGLQARAKTTHAKIAARLKKAAFELKEHHSYILPPLSHEEFASRWNEVYGNNLATFAFYCVIYPDDKEMFELVLTFLDRMASYPDWYVESSRGADQVPVGHSLSGYATALDFLLPRLDKERTKRYLEKLKVETAHMYMVFSKGSAWSRQHIHNHAPTNVLAIMLGAMVLERHDHYHHEAKIWRMAAVSNFEKAMAILTYVIDGTSNEGVPYGSYSSRGWTQYLALARRHYGLDHGQHPWFQEHFWFFFATVLPGYQRTMGVGDSNHHWFHGPESQLVFLDSFAMRNGNGNWLADRVRANRTKNPPFGHSSAQEFSTTHTEFLFYDASLGAVEPRWPVRNKTHVFTDWGVATYGGGQPWARGNTFLSFKSSTLNGEAVSDIVQGSLHHPVVKGWENFNAGHEHPDQNSFVFAPNGRYFITEALYAYKMTYLNNVLTFSPMRGSKCNAPWVGQVGECPKWLGYNRLPVPRGEIVSASADGGMVHFAGESAQAYKSSLGIKSVQRSMVLLNPEVLVVLDSVHLDKSSTLTTASTNFHNILHEFKTHQHHSYDGARISYPEGDYSFFWFGIEGQKTARRSLHNETLATEYPVRTTNYVNVTYGVTSDAPTHVAYVFHGPGAKVGDARMAVDPKIMDLVRMELDVDGVTHRISFASLKAPLSVRMKAFGFGGFAQVRIGSREPVVFGSEDTQDGAGVCQAGLVSSDLSVEKVFSGHWKFPAGVVLLAAVVGFFIAPRRVCSQARTKIYTLCRCRGQHLSRKNYIRAWSFVGLLICVNVICFSPIMNLSHDVKCSSENVYPTSPPNVFIASLPGSGAELLGQLFSNSSDFLYLTSHDVTVPVIGGDVTSIDNCHWPVADENDEHKVSGGWFNSMVSEPRLFLNNLPESNQEVEHARRRFRELGSSPTFVLNLLSGFWNTKLTWLHSLSPSKFSFIIFVRDPRGWIHSLLRKDLDALQKPRQKRQLEKILASSRATCSGRAFLGPEYLQLRENEAQHEKQSVVERLAWIWAANTAAAIGSSRSFQVVRFEDVIESPERVAASVMRRLGTTASVTQLNHLVRAVRSGHYSPTHEPPLTRQSRDSWKGGLSDVNIRDIERICGKVMAKLRNT